MDDEFGPFSVNAGQVAGLGGARFQELVNRLLVNELAASKISIDSLRTSYQDNVADRGVDALLQSEIATDWLPAGQSAWQFKAGDLSPANCAKELEGASFAREVLAAGGSYRLVLGKGLEPDLVKSRENELRAKPTQLGYDVAGNRFKVVDGNHLTRWIERFPALAVAPVLRTTGHFALGFESWSGKSKHDYGWVSSEESDDLKAAIEGYLAAGVGGTLRLEGVSGIGKSRGTMEALRGTPYESLVVYVPDAAEIRSADINFLMRQNRSAVLIIDECDRRRHKVLDEQMDNQGAVRLITIGHKDAAAPQFQPLAVASLPDGVIEKVLTLNFPALWPEARRLVVTTCAGNVGWAIFLSRAIAANPRASAPDLIDAAGLREFIIGLVGDDDFLAVSALALLTRFGVESEVAAELETLAEGLGISIDRLKESKRKLERRGLLTKHGRYRAVEPQPLSILLASSAWDELGDEIIQSLIPLLDDDMAERLFLRAADIGSGGPAANALNKLLGPDGPFNSLQSLNDEANAQLLIQLAIVAPSAVMDHLSRIFRSVSAEQLYGMKQMRRSLVWTLEKLAWHSATFESAGDLLLRLALAENESFGNNATGTWVSLFGGVLPATAALPADRLGYLRSNSTNPNAAVRSLVVRAADHALDAHSSVMVSGELQGGALVEPRGVPQSIDAFRQYQRDVIGILGQLAADDDSTVGDSAVGVLVSAIHPVLEVESVRDVLIDALVSLPPGARRRVWTEIGSLRALFDNVESDSFRDATNTAPDVTQRRAGLDELVARLPELPIDERLRVLANARRWDFEDGRLETEIIAVARQLAANDVDNAAALIVQLVSSEPPPQASFELGMALWEIAPTDSSLRSLAAIADAHNLASLTGYLSRSQMQGREAAFDEFLDSAQGSALATTTQLALTVRGRKSSAGWERAYRLQHELPVSEGAPRLFGWHIDVEPERLDLFLNDWLSRIESQADYNAAVDVVAMMTFRKPALKPEIETKVAELVAIRYSFPAIGQQSYDWTRLAGRGLAGNPELVMRTILGLINSGAIMAYEGSEERQLLRAALTAVGPASLPVILDLIDEGAWRIEVDVRGWLSTVYPHDILIEWIGGDASRARRIAPLAEVGPGSFSELVSYLLTNFLEDDEISRDLYGTFTSGSWVGNESARLDRKINQLESWIAHQSSSDGVRAWARDVISRLRRQRETALVREAEDDRS